MEHDPEWLVGDSGRKRPGSCTAAQYEALGDKHESQLRANRTCLLKWSRKVICGVHDAIKAWNIFPLHFNSDQQLERLYFSSVLSYSGSRKHITLPSLSSVGIRTALSEPNGFSHWSCHLIFFRSLGSIGYNFCYFNSDRPSWLGLVGVTVLNSGPLGYPPKVLPALPPSNACCFCRSVSSVGLVAHTSFTSILLSDVHVEARIVFSNKTCKYGIITWPEDIKFDY